MVGKRFKLDQQKTMNLEEQMEAADNTSEMTLNYCYPIWAHNRVCEIVYNLRH